MFREFTILHRNIRRFISHWAELEGKLQLAHALPSVICLNETFFDESTLDAQLWLTGFRRLSQRDRNDGGKGGGIACFVSETCIGHVALIEHNAELKKT